MTDEQYLKNLSVPTRRVDVVLDTDAFAEIDDQFAIAYLLNNSDRLNTVAFYAEGYTSGNRGENMEKSFDEINHIKHLLGRDDIPARLGARETLKDEKTPVLSDASLDLIERAKNYSPENPLYVVGIGVCTNIANALIIAPEIAENIVIIWLGGHAYHWCDTKEYNMYQDYAAARIIMGGKAPFVSLPCFGVVSEFRTTEPEMAKYLKGKNELCDYLYNRTVASECENPYYWSRCIWDVTAVAWLLNDGGKFMNTRICSGRIPDYNGYYEEPTDKQICYVYGINRDILMTDLFKKITK